MGKRKNDWQEVATILSFFGKKVSSARKQYHVFVEEGINMGKRPELTGGGLIRSSGGWKALKSLRKSGIHLKGEERILGDSAFVESVLEWQNEQFERRYRLQAQGYDFDRVVALVAEFFKMRPEEFIRSSKQPVRVRARSLVCYWGVKELGVNVNGTTVARLIGTTQSCVSRAVHCEEQLALKNQYILED